MSRLSLDDTIAALATPPGEGALGMVRLSGSEALTIADRIFHSPRGTQPSRAKTHTIHVGHIVDGDRIIDEVQLAVLRVPKTYTREDMVEITGHGGMLALRTILELALQAGARLAEPGEFTQRAFLNGRIDLAQSEAVLDVIRARTEASLRAALSQLGGHLSQRLLALHDELANLAAHVEATMDFPEDDIAFLEAAQCRQRLQRVADQLDTLVASATTGRILRDGAMVVICGRPNVGKSSLLNALLRANRAIVTPMPGTTRDTIEESVNLRGVHVRLTDTAGIAPTSDPIEQEGIARSRAAIRAADLLLLVFDGSVMLEDADAAFMRELQALRDGTATPAILLLNKCDLGVGVTPAEIQALWGAASVMTVSASQGTGLEALESLMTQQLLGGEVELSDGALVTNIRHQEALRHALAACHATLQALAQRTPLDCVAVDLRAAVQHVGDILGINVQEDLLDRIFRQFCIGK